jgi:hypothetical protein
LIEVELGDLKKVGRDISELLGQKLKRGVTVKGDMLIVPDTDNQRFGMKDVKMQVKHALYRLGLSDEYRVLSEHHRIRIVRVKEKPKPRIARKGSAPPPSQSLPYLFP